MKHKRNASGTIEIPMAPMIDVVFLLLIYFLVTQKDQLVEAHLAVNLPSPNARAETPETKPSLLEIEVHPGQYYLGKAPHTLPELQEMLAKLTAYDSDQTVIIKTSVMARTQELVDVLDICTALELDKLNVMTLK